jgi:hypothetical protein
MPQFDFYSFFTQTFWFSIITCFFYLMYLKLPLYNTSEVLKFREKFKTLYSLNSASSSAKALYEKVIFVTFKKSN